jgi:hypothetical protein
MSKLSSICLWTFAVIALGAMALPIYRSLAELDEPIPPSYHEYTVLDLETSTQMVMVGDDNEKKYNVKDTAWRDEHYLYENIDKAPKSGMKVVIIATSNQLYE